MSDKVKEVFVCFHKSKGGEFDQVLTGATAEEVTTRSEEAEKPYKFVELGIEGGDTDPEDVESEVAKKSKPEEPVSSQNQPEQESEPDSIASLCFRMMNEFDRNILSYHRLINLTAFMRKALQRSGVQSNLHKTAKEKGTLVSDVEEHELYVIPIEDFDSMREAMLRMQEVDEGMQILPSSILLSLIASFDSIIGDFAKTLLNIEPDRLDTREKTIPVRNIFTMKDIESFKEKYIDDEVSDLLRGSHQSQVRYLEKLIDTDIIDHHSRWPNFIEVFERRNAYAHTNGAVNKAYLTNLAKVKYPIDHLNEGDELRLNEAYLHKAVDYLAEFGTLLAFVTWRKLGSQPIEAYEALSEAAYALITKRRHKLAVWLLDFALHRQSRKGIADIVLRRMIINLANAQKKSGDDDACQKTLGELDWSASSMAFQLAIASLKSDSLKAVELLPKAAAADEVTTQHIREWPVYDWIRDDEDFRSAFKKTFDEELLETSDAPPQDLTTADDEKTVH